MNSDENRSAPSSASTTSSDQKNQPASDAKGHAKLTEAQLLQQTAAEVKQAISRTVARLKQDALTAADVRLWSQEHPWAVVGAAAAAGFVAATLVTPAKDQDLKDKFSELVDTLKSQDKRDGKTGETSSGGGLFAPLMAMAAGAAQNYVMALIHPPAPPEQTEEQQAADAAANGAPQAAPVG
jgi:ElaB/YqjD/DUF883 family membrane-anchored ribosome-binding protein